MDIFVSFVFILIDAFDFSFSSSIKREKSQKIFYGQSQAGSIAPYAPIIGHPLGEGAPGKGGDFVQDPVEVLDFPLLEGDTEQSKLRNSPSQVGIILNSIKPQ